MVHVNCCRCNKDCDKVAIFLNIEHVSNYATSHRDIGSNTMGHVDAEFKVALCQDCNRDLGLPNPYDLEKGMKVKFGPARLL